MIQAKIRYFKPCKALQAISTYNTLFATTDSSHCYKSKISNVSTALRQYRLFSSKGQRSVSTQRFSSNRNLLSSSQELLSDANAEVTNQKDLADSHSNLKFHEKRLPKDEFAAIATLLFQSEGSAKYPFAREITNLKAKTESKRSIRKSITKSVKRLTITNDAQKNNADLDLLKTFKSNSFNSSAIFKSTSDQETAKLEYLQKVRNFVSSAETLDINAIFSFLNTNSVPQNVLDSHEQNIELIKEFILNSSQATFPAVSHAIQFILYKNFSSNNLSSAPSLTIALEQDILESHSYSLIQLLLIRALDIYPETTYSNESDLIKQNTNNGITVVFDQLSNILDFFNSDSNKQHITLNDLFLRLVSRSGPVELAKATFLKFVDNYGANLSQNTIDEFFQALYRSSQANYNASGSFSIENFDEALVKYQQFFNPRNLTPPVAQFLLSTTTSLDEFYKALNLIEASEYQDEILSKCQTYIFNACIKCFENTNKFESTTDPLYDTENKLFYTKLMAQLFGLLNRFASSTGGISKQVLDQCLATCIKVGNSAGIYYVFCLQAKLKSKQHDPSPNSSEEASKHLLISKNTIDEIMQFYPFSSGFISKEKSKLPYLWAINDAIIVDSVREEAILHYLRQSQLDNPLQESNSYCKYLETLGRSNFLDLLKYEWSATLSPLLGNGLSDAHINDPRFQNILISFISASKANDQSLTLSFSVLDELLRLSTKSQLSHDFVLALLLKIVSERLLPYGPTLIHLAKWFISSTDVSYWNDNDIEKVFNSRSLVRSAISDKQEKFGAELLDRPTENSGNEIPDDVGKYLTTLVLQVRKGEDVSTALELLIDV